MGRLSGKVAFITGAARGQGRAEAIRFAEEGADIIALDICTNVEGVPYPGATPDDLAETVRGVERLDRRIVAREADVRDSAAVKAVVDEGVAELGGLDIVVANAGIVNYGPIEEISDEDWDTMIDINLTGAWKTTKAAVPHLRARGGGSIIITSSAAGLIAPSNLGHYVAAKHGLVGLMRVLANELAPAMIRANSLHPTQVATPMILNDVTYRLFRPDLDAPGQQDIVDISTQMNGLPIPWVEPEDIANAALFLASDESRHITGLTMTVDAGISIKVATPH
jgi:SDR family mycofactocin-dependent oxidoreductase